MISPWFPPRSRVGALRPGRFARRLPELGFEPGVVHLGPRADGPDAQLVLTRAAGSAPGTGQRPSALRETIDRSLPVDGWAPWLWAKRAAVLRFARAFEPDVVWSTADPWSSLWLGRWVAQRLRRPWVADLRDPWTLCGVRHARRPWLTRAVDARIERHTLDRAARVVFTAQRTADRYATTRPEWGPKIRVITNGFEGEPLPFDHRRSNDGPLRLRFFGRFRPLASATRIIEVLAARPRAPVKVHCVGGLDREDAARARTAGVDDHFVDDEPVSPERGRSVLRGSDLLLLSTEPGRDEILPGKLFEYLAAGRPILSLADSPELQAILHRTGAGVQFGRHQAPAAAAFLDRCGAASSVSLPTPPNPAAVADYRADRGAEQLARLLGEVMEEARARR
jgi:glycosyltransferase involved in cell wall biosynthesis